MSDCTHLGTIEADTAYTVHEFRRRTGIGEYAYRQFVEKGMPTISIGRQIFIRGQDFIEWLGGHAAK